MRRVHCAHLLTREGWQDDVLLSIDAKGMVTALEANADSAGAQSLEGYVLPGQVNLHSHAFQRAMVGLSERGLRGQTDSFWTWRKVMYQLADSFRPEQLQAVAAQLYVEMLEAGMTSVGEFHYLHHGKAGARYQNPAEMCLAIVSAAQQTGIALTLLPVWYQYAGFGKQNPGPHQLRFCHSSADDFLKLVESISGTISGLPNGRLGIAPHSLRAVEPRELMQGVEAFHQTHPQGPIHIHISEQPQEVSQCQDYLGQRPVEFVLSQGIDQRWCLVHATHLVSEELQGLAKSGAVAGLCPTTEANLGDGIFAAEDFLNAGGLFGIGSDSHCTVDAAEELRLLEYGQRLLKGRRAVLLGPGVEGEMVEQGEYLWAQAVAGGAQALGQPAAGIEVGQRADLVELDPSHARLVGLSASQALNAFIFGSCTGAVSTVLVGGQTQVAAGKHLLRDEIAARFRETLAELLKEL